jgi:hypothetical protein
MSGQIERVEPRTVEGVEFYASSSTEETGLSIVGISLLCGVGATTISTLVTNLSDSNKTGYKELEHLRGLDLTCAISSNQNAKVIKDIYAAEIISYYADKGVEVAKASRKKFQTIGFRSWVKEVTGLSKGATVTGDLDLVQKSLNQILDVLTTTNARLSSLEQKTGGYTKAIIEMPGLEAWMSKYDEYDENQLALPDGELFTLGEYLWEMKKLKFEKPAMSLFANKVSFVYRTMSEARPERKRGTSSKGYQTPMTNAYRRRDFPLLDIAFKQTVLEL